MSKHTLGEFLLARFMGALLPVEEDKPVIPGTVGELVDPLDSLLCDATRFKFKEKIPLEEVCKILSEYYTSIHWENIIEMSDQGTIMGDVWPAEANTFLGVFGAYEKDPSGHQETDILFVCLCPCIG
ncbi:MAG: hypothetical protein WCG97_00195 [bacterium]